MKDRSYGVNMQRSVLNSAEAAAESIRLRGYWTMNNVFSSEELADLRTRIDTVYTTQEKESGAARLAEIGEKDVARALLAYDDYFLHRVAAHSAIREIVTHVIGSYHVLSLQNAIINRPGTDHHQGAWHRDLPYQNFIGTPILALNALVCVDPFTVETGCTWCVPFSHREQHIPSDRYINENKVPLEAQPGSVVFFDSMLFHRAGVNISQITRRAINNLYTTGVIRQQINLPAMLQGKFSSDPALSTLLGYGAATPESVMDYRSKRTSK
jgi:ectoine hydroxylase-related dioxygenase (phytanoyl-CoA dioxygenase family)